MSRTNHRNYYRLLHVQPDAPLEVIKASYRALMRSLKHHPDLGGDQWDAALINEAYEVLSVPEKRKTYDRERRSLGNSVSQIARSPSRANSQPDQSRTRLHRFTSRAPNQSVYASARSVTPRTEPDVDTSTKSVEGAADRSRGWSISPSETRTRAQLGGSITKQTFTTEWIHRARTRRQLKSSICLRPGSDSLPGNS